MRAGGGDAVARCRPRPKRRCWHPSPGLGYIGLGPMGPGVHVSHQAPVECYVSPGLVPYEAAPAAMAARVEAIAAGGARELIWLLEHPPLYTAGTSARDDDLLDAHRFP